MESVNPVRSDPELRGLLKRLDRIKKYKTFNRWKSKFLARLESLVPEKGIAPAEKNCNEFSKVIEDTIKCASKVTGFIEKGELSAEKKTVKASLAFNALTHDHLTTAVEKIQRLIPSTGREEKQVGFTKFHIGAVLIRQGFHQYITMKQIEDALTTIAEKMGDVADKQQLNLFQEYSVRLRTFCDIMADLNLYEIMMKCVGFAEAPEEEESSDEEPMKIEIEVETSDGSTKTIKLEVEPSDTIESIKNMIAEDIGVEPGKQIIKFKGNELPNNSTVGKAGIKDGLKLSAEPLRIPIIVNTYDGKQIELMVDPDGDCLSDIKRLLEQRETGVPATNQELFLGDKNLSSDNAKAAEYGIKSNTVLYMEPKTIIVQAKMPDGTKHDVQVSPSDTPEQVKDKIESKTGMAATTQILKFKGKAFPTGKTLKDMGVRDGDEIQVDASQIPVTVKTKDGKTIGIMVDPKDTVEDIKNQLEKKTGVPANQQVLCIDDQIGKELANDMTAVGSGVKAGSTLALTAKTMKISIELPDGSKHKIEIDAMDSTSDIQAQIARTKSLAALMVVGGGKSGRTLEIQTHKVFGTKK